MKKSFHLAFPITDLEKTIEFYVDLLGCTIGRRSSNWVDLNFFGNQITAQVNEEAICKLPYYRSESDSYPVYHFGVVLEWKEWHELKDRLSDSNYSFLIEPKIVFEGEVGEQYTMFLEDPNGYPLEFKTFHKEEDLFKFE